MRKSFAPSRANIKTAYNPPVQVQKSLDNEKNSSNSSSELRKFTVDYGKLQTRKHKIYSDQGFIEIRGIKVVLKDEGGKFLGSINVKEEITEGMNLQIGSKDVRVVDDISPNNRKQALPMALTTLRSDSKVARKSFKSPLIEPEDNEIKNEKISEISGLKRPSTSSTGFDDDDDDDGENHPVKRSRLPPLQTEEKKCEIPSSVLSHLKGYQKDGVEFMFRCVVGESMAGYYGCVLADEMGLGKTLQTLALIAALRKLKIVKRVLIVCPTTLVTNWNREVEKWLKELRIFTFIVDGKKPIKEFVNSLHIPIMLVSYDMLLRQKDEIGKIKFDLMVFDEGHRMKNENGKTYKALVDFECRRRVLITGTPFQNDVHEFYAIVNFVNPGVFGRYNEFRNEYEIPILRGQQADADDDEVELSQLKAKEIHEKSEKFIIRRSQCEIQNEMPMKQEIIVVVRPSTSQQEMILKVLEFFKSEEEKKSATRNPLEIITILKKICNHPYLISTQNDKEKDLIMKLFNETNRKCLAGYPIAKSGKLKVLSSLLDDIFERQEKVVVVSYSTQTLDMLELTLRKKNFEFTRLDGSTKTEERGKIVNSFNDVNSKTFCFLLSAKSGGVGLNLIGASRLILYDCDWNPANDAQVCARIFRQGQKKDVFIYRLITCGTIEEKILQRQISKNILGEAIFESETCTNSGNIFHESESRELFNSEMTNFLECQTHHIIGCECEGFGEIPFQLFNDDDEDEKLNNKRCESMKSHELMAYEHHQKPYSDEFMTEIGLKDVENEVLFIFRQTTGNF